MKFSELSINSLQIIIKMIYISLKVDYAIKMEKTSIISLDKTFEEFKTKHKYQILENYWKRRKKECEKNLSKFC